MTGKFFNTHFFFVGWKKKKVGGGGQWSNFFCPQSEHVSLKPIYKHLSLTENKRGGSYSPKRNLMRFNDKTAVIF